VKKLCAVLVAAGVLLSASACAPSEPEAASSPGTTTKGTAAPPKGTKPTKRGPNIVRILTDDQDINSLAVMKKTLSLLGATGTIYKDSVVSLSLCCPARATLLTGQYAHNHHVWDNGGNTGGYLHFDNADNSLAPWLKKAGYQTAHVGKYMNGYGKSQVKEIPKGWDSWFNIVDEDRESYPYYGYTISDNGTSRTYGKADEDYVTDVFTDRAVSDVKTMAASGKPFFLDFWPTAPHTGNGRVPTKHLGPAPGPQYENANPGAQAPRTENWLPEKNEIPEGLQVFGELYRAANGGVKNFPQLIDDSYRDYLNSLLSVDDAVERLVNELKAAGQLENTVIIFTSDNGLMWGNHGLANMKWEPYEESLRVPLIISGPGFPKGVTVDQPVGNIDIAPTILALAGAPAGRTMDGRSLLPVTPKAPGKDRAILIESNLYDPAKPYQFPGDGVPRFKGVRGGGFQYTEWADGTVELFDLEKDLAEMHNVAEDPRFADDKAKLKEALGKLNNCAGPACNVDVVGLTHP